MESQIDGLCPRLNKEQIAELTAFGTIRTVEKNEYLIKSGDKNYDFFVIALEGEKHLEQVIAENNLTGERTLFEVEDLFLFLGAKPCSDWLTGVSYLDEKGFVYTDKEMSKDAIKHYKWPLERPPQTLETCVPGLFAVGDIRNGLVKGVLFAVGEGSMAVSQVHTFLST